VLVDRWSATAETHATTEELLAVLTHPEEIRRWSPVDFDVDDLAARRLAAGTRTTVTGRLAGVPVSFDVRVHTADEARLELSADGPIGLDVRYDLAAATTGAEMTASVAVRKGGGLTGRVVAKAAEAMLSAGVLDGAAGRIVQAAESRVLAVAA
jgi:hypothetical protein